jgi:ribosomal 50S subunit-associated protein YjgA (DUF615 family)
VAARVTDPSPPIGPIGQTEKKMDLKTRRKTSALLARIVDSDCEAIGDRISDWPHVDQENLMLVLDRLVRCQSQDEIAQTLANLEWQHQVQIFTLANFGYKSIVKAIMDKEIFLEEIEDSTGNDLD